MSSANDFSIGQTSTPSSHAKQSGSRFHVVALTVMLLVSVALNVMLALKIRELTGTQNTLRAGRELEAGTAVPSITARRLDGKSETITYADSTRPTVIYVFTPQCIWCTRNLDNLKTLVDQKGKDYRFIGISLSKEGLEKYVADHQLTFPIYTDRQKWEKHTRWAERRRRWLSRRRERCYKTGREHMPVSRSPGSRNILT